MVEPTHARRLGGFTPLSRLLPRLVADHEEHKIREDRGWTVWAISGRRQEGLLDELLLIEGQVGVVFLGLQMATIA